MTENCSVAIIILNWNGKEDTLECLESVFRLDYPNFEVIVVDNGSSDGSVEAVRDAYPQATLIENGANLGFSGGNNVGIRYALERGAEYVWLLNNDTTVEPDSLRSLVACAEAHPKVGMLSPVIYYYDEPEAVWFAGGVIDWRTGRTNHLCVPGAFSAADSEERYICGCAILIKRKTIERIGVLDERFSPAFYEDTDWSVRCVEKGFQLAIAKDAKIFHKGSVSTGGSRSKRYRNLLTKSRFCFMEKYKDRFGKKAGHHRKFIAGCIEEYLTFSKNNSIDEAQGVLHALYDIYTGRWVVSNPKAKEMTKRTILRHPYFWVNVMRGDWPLVFSSLRSKVCSISNKVRQHGAQ